MARLETLTTWFCGCFGMVLLGVSILVVPATAFADAGTDAGNNCLMGCSSDYSPGTSDYDTCVAYCCVLRCNGDSTCQGTCCSIGCTGSDGDCGKQCTQQVPVISCLPARCQTPTMGCTNDCNQQPCNDGGKDPRFARCNSTNSGCRCV